MRKIIAAMQISLDGFIEGPGGELDWAMAEDKYLWKEVFEMLKTVDACVLGRVMYPDYEKYWMAVLENPTGVLSISGMAPTKNEIAYARLADTIPHYVLSRTLEKVEWKNTRIIRDIDDIGKMKEQPGKNIYAVGGATLVSGLVNAGLVDELRLMVNPLLLGGGKALFKDVHERHGLKLVQSRPLKSGKIALRYAA